MTALINFIIIFSSVVLLYVYLGYPLFLGIMAFIRPGKKIQKQDIRPKVSFLISCYNEENVLRAKLDNTLAIDYPRDKFEIIVISDESTDATDDIAQEYSPFGVKLIRQPERRGKTMGLNLAMSQVQGDIIVFSDANAMYKKNAVIQLVKNFSDDTIGYVVGDAKYSDTLSSASASAKSEITYWQYELFVKKMESKIHSMVGGDGAIYAIRRELYEELLETDINDFVNPLQIILKGYRGIYEPQAICLEETSGSFHKEFGRKVRIVNRSFSGLMRTKSVLNPFKTGIFSLEIVSHKLLRWLAPIFLIAFLASVLFLSVYGGDNTQIFRFISLIMTFFLLTAYVGHCFSDDPNLPAFFYYPYYFMVVNVASFIGVSRSLMGRVQATWDPPRGDSLSSFSSSKDWDKFFIHCSAVVVFYVFLYQLEKLTDVPNLTIHALFWISLIIISYVYIGYPLALNVLSRLYRRRHQVLDHTKTVTLLICAYNEEEVLEEKIRNSLELDYPPEKLKIVIASDGSTDRTNEIARRYENDRLELYAYAHRRGKIGVINKTVPLLRSEIIVFSDANTYYKRDAIKKLVRNFHDPSVGGASADVIILNKETTFSKSESIYYTYERWIQKKESEIGSIVGADGGMYAIRRELFIPPSDNIILDDFVISMNVANNGHRLIYEGEAKGFEKSTISYKQEFLRKSRVLAGAIQALKQYEGIPSLRQKKLFLCFFSHKLLRWITPLFLVLFFSTNLALAFFKVHVAFTALFMIQCLFYIVAALGLIFQHHGRLSFLSIPFYFCMENGAALYGIYKGLFNKQAVTWRKFSREKERIAQELQS